MLKINTFNLKVVIMDSDYYAMQSINSYLAWDRRTRVTFMTTQLEDFWAYLHEATPAELPDIIILDADHLGTPQAVRQVLNRIHEIVLQTMIVCLSQTNDPALVNVIAESAAKAFLLKHEVGMQIAWAVIYAIDHDFTVTPSVLLGMKDKKNRRLLNARILPAQRHYPEMTDRIRQAIRLCVIEGMPAHLAADEMGISLHTIRGYIKEGYRILESYDQREYPTDMTPQERAFMRFTALANEDHPEA